MAEHGRRQVARLEADGGDTSIARRWDSRRLNSPNDLAVRSDGSIYFTDPPWGIVDRPDARELDFNGVFRIDADGELHLEAAWPDRGFDETPRPNGVALSPSETTLYVSDDRGARVWRYDVESTGALRGPTEEIGTRPVPDGLAVDRDGNLFVATSEGVDVFDAEGEPWGLIPVAGASNVAFGDEDGRSLFITAGSSVYRVRL